VVSDVIEKDKRLNEIPLTQLRKFSARFDVDVAKVFDVRRSLSARTAVGAPSPKNVKAQIKSWRERLG
jgi:argininosuccinate lyase